MAIKISVIIPCKNEERDIPKCLEAFAKQKIQKGLFEVIFIDANSTDKTLEIIKKYKGKIRNLLVAKETGHTKSAANARNQGAKIARGKILVFYDADVVAHPQYLSEISKGFYDYADAASSEVKAYPSKSTWAHLREHESMASDYLVKKGSASFFANIFRKKTFLRIGGYRSRFRYGEDLVMLDRLKEQNAKIVHLKKAIVMHKDPDSLGEIASQARFWGRGFHELFLSDPTRHLPRLLLVIARALWLPLFLIYLAFPFNLLLFTVAILYLATLVDGIFVFYRSMKMGGKLKYALLLIPFRMIRSFYFLQGVLTETAIKIFQ
jgi:cellulose synthase/poly-beta-1,6-N-acetylglucosamine synthase-like glycosyltransferase